MKDRRAEARWLSAVRELTPERPQAEGGAEDAQERGTHGGSLLSRGRRRAVPVAGVGRGDYH